MANKKKIATATTAVALAAALLLGGTFAWQSISQTALNEKEAVINPGGRLHDDFNGTNKDVYVENFAEDTIYARVRLDEYFEIVMNKNTPAEKTEIVTTGATKDKTNTYITHKFDDNNTTDDWWNWTTGGSTVYMPTFNKNKDSLKADINGTYENDYDDYVEYTEGKEVTADATYDNDSNNLEDDGVVKVEEKHTATETGTAKFISMAEWLELEDDTDNYWVYDTDGWVYYSSPIKSGTATGLLLDEISLEQVMDDSYYYAINVVGQFITADDLGKDDGTGFYDTDAGTVPSDDALTLLEKIGVDVGEDEDTAEYILTINEHAIIGSENNKGLTMTLTADGDTVTDQATFSVNSTNVSVNSSNQLIASSTAEMNAPLEKYQVTASIKGKKVATADLYMYDESKHELDQSYYIVEIDSGEEYCWFDHQEPSTILEAPISSGCIWKYGDSVDKIYHCVVQGNFTVKAAVEKMVRFINGTQTPEGKESCELCGYLSAGSPEDEVIDYQTLVLYTTSVNTIALSSDLSTNKPIKIVDEEGNQVPEDNLAIKTIKDDEGLQDLTKDVDYAFENGYLKFITIANVHQEILVCNKEYTFWGYIVFPTNSDSVILKNEVDYCGSLDVIYAKINQPITVFCKEKDAYIDEERTDFSLQEPVLNVRLTGEKFTFENNQLTITDSSYVGKLLMIYYEESGSGCTPCIAYIYILPEDN